MLEVYNFLKCAQTILYRLGYYFNKVLRTSYTIFALHCTTTDTFRLLRDPQSCSFTIILPQQHIITANVWLLCAQAGNYIHHVIIIWPRKYTVQNSRVYGNKEPLTYKFTLRLHIIVVAGIVKNT